MFFFLFRNVCLLIIKLYNTTLQKPSTSAYSSSDTNQCILITREKLFIVLLLLKAKGILPKLRTILFQNNSANLRRSWNRTSQPSSNDLQLCFSLRSSIAPQIKNALIITLFPTIPNTVCCFVAWQQQRFNKGSWLESCHAVRRLKKQILSTGAISSLHF